VLSCVAYLVLRPENFSFTPTAIDPYIYSGYSLNLDRVIDAAGQGRYYVSRWSMYLPAYVMTSITGPVLGRLLLRLLLTVLMLVVVWRFGRRWNWSRAQELLVGLVLITMPTFVRALFTDYVEHVVVICGVVLVCLCLRERQHALNDVAIGVLLALMMVANPFAVVVAIAPIATALWFGRTTWSGRGIALGTMFASFVLTVALGWLYFRVRYGLPNVYEPTIDFLTNAPRDPFSSPRLEWLGKFTWLYMPPVVIAVYLGLVRLHRATLDRVERRLIAICSFQYVLHWIDQFTRHSGLEVPSYWSFLYPTLGLLIAIGLARAVRGVPAVALAGLGVVWVAMLSVGIPHRLHLPAALRFAAVMVVAVAVILVIGRRTVPLAAGCTLLVLGWMQIGPPAYVPFDYHPFDMSPHYELLFRQAPYTPERVYDEGAWYVDQLEPLPETTDAWFLSPDGFTYIHFLLSGVAITNRVIDRTETGVGAMERVLAEEGRTDPVVVVIMGTVAGVDDKLTDWADELGPWTVVSDVTRRSGDRNRIAVIRWDRADDVWATPAVR